MPHNPRHQQKRRPRRSDRISDVNRTRGPRPTGPVKYAAPAPVGTRQPGQPIMQPEMGKVPSLGGSRRVPDSKPPKTSSGPKRSDMLGSLIGADQARNSQMSQYASFPTASGSDAAFPNEGPLKNAPASQTSVSKLDRAAAADSKSKDMLLKSGLRLAGEDSLRSGLSANPDLSPQMRSKLRDTGVGQGTDEKGLPSNNILGQPQPTLGYYSGQLGTELSAGSGTVIAPGQEQNVMDSRIRSKLNAFNPQSLIVKSEADLELEGIRKRQQAAKDEMSAMSAEREKLNPTYNASDPFNMAMSASPQMPTSSEAQSTLSDLGFDSSPRASAMRARDRFARATQPGGLPDVPFRSRTPETGRKTLPDVRAEFTPREAKPLSSFPDKQGNTQEFRGLANSLQQAQEIQGRPRSNQEPQSGQGSDDGRIRMRSTVNRQTLPDGRQVTFGGGLNVENGNIITTDAAGNKRAVILPSSGNSIGLRTAEVDSQGNFVPGTFKTQSDEARRKERQDLAILRGNQPGASAEDKLAGQQAQEAQDKYAAYKARRDKRRSDALDIRQAANAMRGYGPIGMQNVGFSSMGQNINPEFAMKYGQTGPSLAQAAGMVRQQRDAQERMDNAMKEQREREDQKARQDMILEAYKSNPNDPRLADAFSQQLGLRDFTPDEAFDKKVSDKVQRNELAFDPRSFPRTATAMSNLGAEQKSQVANGLYDLLTDDDFSTSEKQAMLSGVSDDMVASLIDGTEFDEKTLDFEQKEELMTLYRDVMGKAAPQPEPRFARPSGDQPMIPLGF